MVRIALFVIAAFVASSLGATEASAKDIVLVKLRGTSEPGAKRATSRPAKAKAKPTRAAKRSRTAAKKRKAAAKPKAKPRRAAKSSAPRPMP